MPDLPPSVIEKSSQTSTNALAAGHYRLRYPWLRMFGLFWISIDLQKLLLAVVAIFLLAGGNWCIDQLPFAGEPTPQIAEEINVQSATTQPTATNWPWQQGIGLNSQSVTNPASWQFLVSPIESVVSPGFVLFQHDTTWPQLATAWTRLLWALAVWALFGGAITRIAAVQIGADRKLNHFQAIKFTAKRFLSYYSAPLVPLAGIGCIWGLSLLGGLVGRIPTAGPWIVGLFWGVALVFGLLMALTLLGAVAGWPLMFTTISVEGSDAPDGLSRSYGYVFAKPWYYLFLLSLTAVLGVVVFLFVTLLANLSAYFAVWAVAWGMGTADIVANPLAQFWNGLLAMFVVAFAISYFWSAMTMIYYLLRRSVDANDFSDLFLEGEQQDELMLFGEDDADDQDVNS